MTDFLINWLGNVPSAALPYALAALGLIVSERAGVLNLTAEGLLLVGALAGVGASLTFPGHPWLALGAAAGAAAVASLLFAVLVVLLRVDQVISGLAVVFFCQGLTSLVGTLADWQNRPISGFAPLDLGPIADIPVVGRVLADQDPMVWVGIALFAAVNHVLFSTMTGLRLRAVGENPVAADTSGVGIVGTRIAAVVVGSALVGLAGGYLSVVSTKIWFAGMTGGRGWIAIALVIFARWYPWRALAGAVLFGCIESLVPRIAAAGIRVPQYFMLMAPYLVTLGVMMWVGRRRGVVLSGEPAALGRAHLREERS